MCQIKGVVTWKINTGHIAKKLGVNIGGWGAFSVTGRYRWEAPVFAVRQAIFCVEKKTADVLLSISYRLFTPMGVTQQTIFLLTSLCKRLTVEDTRTELAKTSGLHRNARFDLV